MSRLGIDFGTSNSAAGVMAGNRPFLIPLEEDRQTLPTAVFFDPHAKTTRFGAAANAALIGGREGRYMRALKSVLGTPLMHETRLIAHERLTLIEVIARFLSMIRDRATAFTGQTFDAVISGRPVRFHDDPDRHDRALADLRLAYEAAGFTDVDFLPEPEAAAFAADPLPPGEYGLIIDIGGGTSDFSVFERLPDVTRVVASGGMRLGGTDFDKALSLAHVMPLLGRGGAVRDTFGSGTSIAPAALFNDLASWEKIAFLYTPATLRVARDMRRLAVDPDPFARLEAVLEEETGHDIAFAVEAGKIAANAGSDVGTDLSIVEPGLAAPFGPGALTAELGDMAARIAEGAVATVLDAGLTPDRIAQVVHVGGSSLMSVVSDAVMARFPGAAPVRRAAFTAVVEGLARAAGRP